MYLTTHARAGGIQHFGAEIRFPRQSVRAYNQSQYVTRHFWGVKIIHLRPMRLDATAQNTFVVEGGQQKSVEKEAPNDWK